MNQDIDFKALKPLLTKYSKLVRQHAVFTAVLLVLLAYLIVVYKISDLAKAEPSPDQENTVQTAIVPRIDQKTISHIQSLEDNNTDIHALFEQARNNPFAE